MIKYILLFATAITMGYSSSFCQAIGKLLIISDQSCNLVIDGDKEQSLNANTPLKLELLEGDHIIQAKALGIEKMEIVSIVANKQKVFKLNFRKDQQLEAPLAASPNVKLAPVLISNLSIDIPSQFVENPEPLVYYYGFTEGDKLVLDLKMSNKKGTNVIEISSYPDGHTIYSNSKFSNLDALEVKIPQKGIYTIILYTNHFFPRTANFTISRIPGSKEAINFNTKVVAKRKYEVVNIQEPIKYYINSTSHEEWKGGKSRTIVPVNLPSNTIEWYYTVSASRNEQEIKSNLKNISLAGELGKTLYGLNPATTALDIGLSLITQPPGSDYCDVYLINHDSYSLFRNGQKFSHFTEGTRENVRAAKAKITKNNKGQYYLGIQNSDTWHGVHVGVEVVAITSELYLKMEGE